MRNLEGYIIAAIIGIFFFLLVSIIIMNTTVKLVRKDVQEWALKYEYAEYDRKTGELIIINEEVKDLLENFTWSR
jgi:uncharacterized membrane protein (DUF106 family)